MLNVQGDSCRAIGDGIADDTAALNRAFTIAREANTGVPIYIPHGRYRVTAPLDWGGFGNTHILVYGDGAKSGGGAVASIIEIDATNIVGVDFSGNEGGEIRDLQITSKAGRTPWHGLLIANALPNNRGGLVNLRGVQVSGAFNRAALVVYAADLCSFDHVIASTAWDAAVALYVVNPYGITPVWPIASPFRVLSPDTGITNFTSFGGFYGLGGTARTAWLVHNISGLASSYGENFIFGGVNAAAVETIHATALEMYGVRHEAGDACSFLRTDGLKNSHFSGQVQKSGALPLIDLLPGAVLSNSVIRLGPSDTGASLIDTDRLVQVFGNELWLMDGMKLRLTNSGALASGNMIHNVTGTPGEVVLPNNGWGNVEFTFSLGGQIKLDGRVLSWGAADSGGLGFRGLRVPNQ